MNGADRDLSCSARSCQMFLSKYFGKFTYIILGLLFVSLDVRSFLFFYCPGICGYPRDCFFRSGIFQGLLSYSPSSSSRIFRIRKTVYPAITRIRMIGYQWDPQSAKLMCPSASLLSAGMLSPVFPLSVCICSGLCAVCDICSIIGTCICIGLCTFCHILTIRLV